MKKCLLLVALLIVSQLNIVSAQEVPLFKVQDTVCVNQPVSILDYVRGAQSYYWGFCSGYVLDNPVGTNIGGLSAIKHPGDIDVVKDPKTGLYYGFVTNTDTKEFLRLNYGASLSNTPTVTNLSNLTNVLPSFPTAVYPVRDTANWYVFVTAGTDDKNSCLARIDFGPTLDNPTPNIANFGNLHGMFNGPRGISVTKDEFGHFWGYLVNQTSSELIQLDFSFNISLTPVPFNIGNMGGVLGSPSDLALVRDDRYWYLFITNMANSSLARVDLGAYLGGAHDGVNLGSINGFVAGPSAISLVKDCGAWEAFITDTIGNQLIRVNMPSIVGPYTAFDYGNIGNENYVIGLSRIIRDRDNVYGFAVNQQDSTISRIDFAGCNHASASSSLDSIAPVYHYDTPGVYNIYLETDGGLPDMRSYCKTITVLPVPQIMITQDTTLCAGDSIQIHVFSDSTSQILWSPSYNISDTFLNFATIYPAYSQVYTVTLTYPDGCITDTTVSVQISKAYADAGPDRTIGDGGTTTLGGTTPMQPNYTYTWFPTQFLSNPYIANPTVSLPYDLTYYLKVTEHNDTFKCAAMDTVVVHVTCADLVLPNAFSPASPNPESNKFGILNKQIIKLNYLRIYDRWGELVFETSDPTQKWDGSINGKGAPLGVYVWEADGFCQSGTRFRKSGNVTLVR